ncbi:hypothetical protein K1719_043760 [Acacia pycnantha]|nr:hypothetical protein K1719_043760 [Acacia pycnantha]
MVLQSYLVRIPTFLLLIFSLHALADLNSEKQALLDFAAAVHHGQKLIGILIPQSALHGWESLAAQMALILRSNSLSGSLPNDILSHPSLRFIHLQHNNFSGDIPHSVSHQLHFLDLAYNSFTGTIPALILNLPYLTGLKLQNNSLSGPIPDLNLSKLKTLNLSYNNLNGSIPSALQKFPASSFRGNLKLCGPPVHQCSSASPSFVLSPPTVSSKPSDLSSRKLNKGAIIAIAFIGFTVLLLPLMMVVLCYLKKRDGGQNATLKEKDDKLKEDFGSGVQELEKTS